MMPFEPTMKPDPRPHRHRAVRIAGHAAEKLLERIVGRTPASTACRPGLHRALDADVHDRTAVAVHNCVKSAARSVTRLPSRGDRATGAFADAATAAFGAVL